MKEYQMKKKLDGVLFAKKCKLEIQGVLERMKKHLEVCPLKVNELNNNEENVENSGPSLQSIPSSSSNIPNSPVTRPRPSSSSVEKFVIKTSKTDKDKLDEQAARFFCIKLVFQAD